MTLQVHSSCRFSLEPTEVVRRRNRPDALDKYVSQLRERIAEQKRPAAFQESSDVLGVVCSFLPYDVLKTMEEMSCNWRRGSLHGQALRLREYVQQHGFGALKWERYFGEVDRIPLPLELIDILKSQCPFFPGNKVEDTHILFLLPQTVDGKPLTLNSLGELVKKPKKDSGGNPTRYPPFTGASKDKYANQTTDKLCWVLMTRGVIPESRNKSFEAQRALIPPQAKGYEIPKGLEAVAGAFLSYVATGKRLFSWTYICCQELGWQEQIKGGDRVIVGFFDARGLCVFNSGCVDPDARGVAVLRKFFGT